MYSRKYDKPKLLFVLDMEPYLEKYWQDGLWAALKVMEKDFIVTPINIQCSSEIDFSGYDFILGWGAFGGPVDNILRGVGKIKPVGLCLGGYAPFRGENTYDVIYYETEWSLEWLKNQIPDGNFVHAFGVNTDIFKEDEAFKYSELSPVFDYMTVGAFSMWKRQSKLVEKTGTRLAVGQLQRNNQRESIAIMADLITNNVMVCDTVEPKKLVAFYNLSRTIYIPAEIMGGGERAVLEARACGKNVEIESDNPKLEELLTSPIWDHKYYAYQLKEGIKSCLK